MSSIINPYFIALITPYEGGHSPKKVKEVYDHYINADLYKIYDKNNQLMAYNSLEKHIQQVIDDRDIVLVTEDINSPSITINAYSRNSTTIYISNSPTVILKDVIYVGIDKDLMTDDMIMKLDEGLITYFTQEKIKECGISKVIKNIIINKKIHLIIDLRIIDQTIAPSAKRYPNQKKYISLNDIQEIIQNFHNISYLDIIGFNDSLDNSSCKYSKITGEVCRVIIKNIFNIKEKSINIFTEDSRFLIYRPVNQISQDDIGWYIIKFLTLKERETFLSNLVDKVITITINDNYKEDMEVYITSTTVQEQNYKSYYTSNNIFDYCLFPEEKLSMVLELLNTNTDSIISNN